MKKVLTALLLISLLFTLCACSIPADSFMSQAKVSSLVKTYGKTPQAEVTISFKTSSTGQKVEVKVVYDLLLEQAPLAVTRFIQIANEGGYDNTLADTLNKDHDYIILGRYKKNESRYFDMRAGDTTFAGEFKQNGYRQPKDGYAKFDMFSLAMYHAADGAHFDSANGTLILSLSSTRTLNPDNYAVFAQLASISVKVDDNDALTYRKVPSFVRDSLYGFSARVTRNIYDASDDNKSPVSASVMSSEVLLKVSILGGKDWSKLPHIG